MLTNWNKLYERAQMSKQSNPSTPYPRKVLYLSERDVEPLITPAEALDHAETAFSLYAKSIKGQNPASFSPMVAYHTKVPNSDIDYRSGTMDPISTLCSTIGFGYADNPAKFGLPSVYVFAVLTDVDTGVPKCLMAQGSFFLSFIRTGAAAVIASKYLAKENPQTITMIGAGNLAKHTLRCHIAQFGIPKQIKVWSRSRSTSEKFVSEMINDVTIPIDIVENPQEAVRDTDIIYCNTRSRKPIIMNEWICEGVHINSFGSDAPGKQELDPKILKRAKVVVDSLEQCKAGGDINVPIAQGLMVPNDVYAELGDIVNGLKQGRETKDEITVMDSTGLAALDVVTFHYAYEKAIANGTGIHLEL